QEGLLYHALADPDSGMYVNQCLLTLSGDLDPAAMEAAWRRGAAAHDILRTFFTWEGLSAPAQAVLGDAPLPFDRHDLTDRTPDEIRARTEELLEERRRAGFDPARAPLTRIDLIRTGEREHRLIWSFHHLLLDGWSMFTVLKDVFAAYEELRRGGDPAVAAPPPFRDHVAWLQRQDGAAAEAYWRRTLRGFAAPTPLPGAAERAGSSAVGLEDAAFAELRLDAETTTALEAMARRLRVTLSSVLQLAWATVLARWSGSDDVVFGTIVSGRPPDLPGFEQMVGLFINTLPVRVGFRPDDTVARALARVRESTAELRQYEFSRLVDVQQWSEVPTGQPLFETILLFENYRKEMPLDAMLESLGVKDVGWFEHTNYPIAFLAIPEERFLLRLVTHRKRVDEDTARRILEHVRSALRSMLAAPEGRLADVSLMSSDEEARLRAEWGAIDGSAREPVHVEFSRRAAERPDAEAVRDPRDGVSYGELDARSNRLARKLRQLGVGRETRVGVCLSPSVRLPETLLGVLKAGGAYVPLDPDYPAGRLAVMAADSGAKVIVGESEPMARLRGAMEAARAGADPADPALPAPVLLAVDADADAEAIAAQDESPLPDAATDPRGLAYIIYTSGSTGTPKGVEVEHGALSNLVAWHRREYGIGPDDRATLVAAFSFDASVWETWPYLAAGAALHIPDEETRLAGEALLSWMGDRGVTTCFLPTPMAAALLADGAAWPGSLRAVLTGGDRLARGPARELPFRFVNHYGPTENAVVATAGAVAAGRELPPIGRAIDGVGAYVLDRSLRPVPVGVPGQLWLGGASVARGYAGRADLTAERFLPDPFGKRGSRMYATGDLVRRRPDGELDFLGRIDRQVKLRGFRIETGEIETVLAQHAGIRRCVVELREDRPGQPELVAYLVADVAPAVDGLRAHLRRKLPEYMVPSAFVTLDELPLTPNGKIDRRALPAPDREAHGAAKTAVAPRNEIEEKLAGVWKRLLDLEKVGVDDNFFDLGANSLLLVRARTEIRNVLDTEIRIVDLFEHPTVAALASYAAGRQGGGAAAAGREAETAGAEAAEEAATRAAGRSRLLKRRRRTEGVND
ncbi:MAG TPA: amino acid adenylation domain-containing protein, partial [bacterium]|nr:amino acid adenylation domain-containing protein [bacterium]